jgi:hypothetical protein
MARSEPTDVNLYYAFDGESCLGCVWEGSSSAKLTMELLLHQFAALPWSWTHNLELKRRVWQK